MVPAKRAKQNYVFEFKTKPDHYRADAFAVRCFDNRFWKTFKKFIKRFGLKHIDAESVAGGAKIFSSPEKKSDREFLVRELEKSIKLHRAARVFLFSHEDCGAYGGSKRFSSFAAELSFHEKEHAKASSFLKKKFPRVQVENFFIDFKGVIRFF